MNSTPNDVLGSVGEFLGPAITFLFGLIMELPDLIVRYPIPFTILLFGVVIVYAARTVMGAVLSLLQKFSLPLGILLLGLLFLMIINSR